MAQADPHQRKAELVGFPAALGDERPEALATLLVEELRYRQNPGCRQEGQGTI